MALTVRSQPSAPLLVGTAPTAPTGLAAVLQAGTLTSAQPGPRVRLTWTNTANNASGVVVERCTGAACTTFATIATLASNVANYTDLAAVPGTVNRYQVTAVNAVGSSAPSNIAEVNVPALPPAVNLISAAVTATGPGNNRTVTATWSIVAGTPAATSFTIQRATSAPGPTTTWANAVTVAAPGTTGNDTGAKPGTTYWYRVVANYTLNGVRISNPSNWVGPVAVP